MIGFYTSIEEMDISELESFLKKDHPIAEIELAKNRLRILQSEQEFRISFQKELETAFNKCSSINSYIHYICKYSCSKYSCDYLNRARKKVGEKFMDEIRDSGKTYPDLLSDFEHSFFNHCKSHGVYSVYIYFYPKGRFVSEANSHPDKPRKVWIATILLPILTLLVMLSILSILLVFINCLNY